MHSADATCLSTTTKGMVTDPVSAIGHAFAIIKTAPFFEDMWYVLYYY